MKLSTKLAAACVAIGAIGGGSIAGVVVAAPPAASGPVVHYKVVERTFVVGSGHTRTYDIKCPAGYLPVGGGAHFGNGSFSGAFPDETGVLESDIDLTHKGWASTVYVASDIGRSSYTADAVCAHW